MRAKVDLRVEVIDGEDVGYILEEHGKIVDIFQEDTYIKEGIHPYILRIVFITDSLLRKMYKLNGKSKVNESENLHD